MSSIMGILIHILHPKTSSQINYIPEDTDFIQDHRSFEDRRQQLIDEYEEKLKTNLCK